MAFGASTLLISAVLFFAAWKQTEKQHYQGAILLILLAGLCLRLFVASDFFIHEWDERYHALVAKNMMTFPFKPMLYKTPVLAYDYQYWVSNHIWLHKPPLPLWLIALSFRCFGVNEWALRLPSILASTIAIGLTFAIAKYYLNQQMALLAAFLHAIHGLIIELTGGRVASDHYDLFFLFFIEWGVFFSILYTKNSQKRWLAILIGLSTGAAILTKWLPGLIVVPIWVTLALGTKMPRRRIGIDLTIILFMVSIVVIPWQWHIFTHFPLEANWEIAYNLRHMTSGLEEHGEPWFYHLNKWRMVYGELIYLPLLWLLYKGRRWLKRSHLKWLSLLIWIFVPLFFFSIAKTKMPAYTLVSAPAVFIVTAFFLAYSLRYKNRFTTKQQWGINGIAILLVLLPIRYAFERIKPFDHRERKHEWAMHLRTLDNQIPTENAILFNTDRPIESMFYTKLVAAYPGIPDEATIERLKREGYDLYFMQEGKAIQLGKHH